MADRARVYAVSAATLAIVLRGVSMLERLSQLIFPRDLPSQEQRVAKPVVPREFSSSSACIGAPKMAADTIVRHAPGCQLRSGSSRRLIRSWSLPSGRVAAAALSDRRPPSVVMAAGGARFASRAWQGAAANITGLILNGPAKESTNHTGACVTLIVERPSGIVR